MDSTTLGLLLFIGIPAWFVAGLVTSILLDDMANLHTNAGPAAVFMVVCWPLAVAAVCIRGAFDFFTAVRR